MQWAPKPANDLGFAEVLLVGELCALSGLQIGSGIHIYELRNSTSANMPETLISRTTPLWIATTALTGLATLASIAVPILGWSMMRS